MKEKTEQLYALFESRVAEAKSSEDIEALRIDFLGKKGHIAELMKGQCHSIGFQRTKHLEPDIVTN